MALAAKHLRAAFGQRGETAPAVAELADLRAEVGNDRMREMGMTALETRKAARDQVRREMAYAAVKQRHDGKLAAISMARKLARRCYHTLRSIDPGKVYAMP